jgi:lipopolysaccharide export LptBFGC system permease protein LptF
MKTLDKYVFRELAVPFIAGFAIILVFFFGTVIYDNIQLIVSRLRQWPDMFYMIFLQTQKYVLMALPSGVIFGAAVTVSRLSRDSELTAMRVAGASLRRIFLAIFMAGVIASAIGYVYQERVIVWAEKQTIETYNRIMRAPGPTPVQANVFFRVDQLYFYVSNVARTPRGMVLSNVMIYEPSPTGFPTLTTAKQAVETNQVWKLEDGRIYKMGSEGEALLTGKFKSLKLDLQKPIGSYLASAQQLPKTLTIPELQKRIKELVRTGADPRSSLLEYYFKLALPLGPLVLVFCVTPLALRFGKSGGFTGTLVGIFIFFFFWQVVIYSKVIGEAGGLNPMYAAWLAIAIFGVLGLLLSSRMEKL